jgi:uncharacterized protein (TIGR03435 family)
MAASGRVCAGRLLTGNFEWDLQLTPDALAPAQTNSSATVPLVTALRDQLGFRLEPGRESVEVLVIDRAERPRPDEPAIIRAR